MRCVTSCPLLPGMRRSMSTRSGRSCWNCLIASSPSAASPTTARFGSVLSRETRPVRTMKWSSTSRMRILGATFISNHGFTYRAELGRLRLRKGDADAHGGSLARRAADLDATADALGALLHAEQAVVRHIRGGDPRGDQAAAVVLYLQRHGVRPENK